MLIREITAVGDYDTVGLTDPNGYLFQMYDRATAEYPRDGEQAFIKKSSVPGMPTNEVYTNGYITSFFIMKDREPIFLLNLTRLYKGYSTTNVVVHSDHTGKGFAVPTYIAVSKHLGVPLYSFGTHTPAGDQIWQTLHKQYPNRVRGINVTTGEDIDFTDLQDSDFNTRAVLLPDK